MAIIMTQAKERIIAKSSQGLTRSRFMAYPRIADQRGFVWKMIMMKVIGMSCRLIVKSKKLIVPESALIYERMKRGSNNFSGI